MAEYLIQDSTLTSIADAIREKTGETAALSPTAMATAIAGIETGGGLPAGISAIACGSFTPTEDISGTYVITHNLDAVPNFWSVTAIGPIDLASKPYCMLSQSFYKITTVRSDGVTLAGSRLIQYCTASGKGAITSSNVSNISGACTFSNIYLSGSTSWKLVAGVTYIWVVGVIDGLK